MRTTRLYILGALLVTGALWFAPGALQLAVGALVLIGAGPMLAALRREHEARGVERAARLIRGRNESAARAPQADRR